jgi:hypothetical protein
MRKIVMVEFNLVLENSKLKEDMGIESLQFSKCTFNIANVEYFRESLDSDGEVEPYTMVILDTGSVLCLDITYEDFKKLYKKAVVNE